MQDALPGQGVFRLDEDARRQPAGCRKVRRQICCQEGSHFIPEFDIRSCQI
jgi:hypothetical protein